MMFQEFGFSEVAALARRAKQRLTSLWGVAPIGPLHLGFDELLLRQRDLQRLGFEHIILVTDYHAMFSHGFSTDAARERALYYQRYFRWCLEPSARVMLGSSIQTSPQYTAELYQLAAKATFGQLRNHLARAPRKADRNGRGRLGDYIGLCMQCLDPVHLGVDLVVAEAGQRKAYSLYNRIDPPLAMRLIAHYLPTGRDILGRFLRESSAATRITLHESRETLERKIRKMYAPPSGQALAPDVVNALLWHFRNSVFPWRHAPVPIQTERGTWVQYSDADRFEADYHSGLLWPATCKKALVEALWDRLRAYAAVPEHEPPTWLDVARATGMPCAAEESRGRGGEGSHLRAAGGA
jgi:hypothetical protein